MWLKSASGSENMSHNKGCNVLQAGFSGSTGTLLPSQEKKENNIGSNAHSASRSTI